MAYIYRTTRHFQSVNGTFYNCGREIEEGEFLTVSSDEQRYFLKLDKEMPRLTSGKPAQKRPPIASEEYKSKQLGDIFNLGLPGGFDGDITTPL